MPAFTPNLNLYKPGGGSTGAIGPDEIADIDRLNTNADTIDTFAGNVTNRLNTLETTRGLVVVRPDSVTGDLGLNADGSLSKVNPTGVRTNIDGVFKPDYDRYRMISTLAFKANASAQGNVLARINGIDYTGATYFRQQIGLEAAASVDAYAASQTSFGAILDGGGTLVEAVSDIYVGSSFLLITSTIIGRGGTVSTYTKTANVEQLTGRPTGLGVSIGQGAQSAYMRFYAYA